jgi:hypothetical protein
MQPLAISKKGGEDENIAASCSHEFTWADFHGDTYVGRDVRPGIWQANP